MRTSGQSVPRRRTRRGIALFGAGFGLVLAVAACGGQSESASGQSGSGESAKSGLQLIRAAYGETTSTKTAKMSMTMKSTMSAANMSGEGKIDFAGKKSVLTFTTPQGTLETRRIGNTVYTKLPQQQGQLSNGKPWVKIDLSKTQQQFSGSLSQMPAGGDPSQMLGFLRGVSDSVTKAGTETVRGVQATHYKVEISVEKLVKKMGEQGQEGMRQFKQMLGTDTLPAGVWLDDQGRVVRYRMTMPMPSVGASPGSGTSGQPAGEMTLTMDLYDYGTPVNVSAPPPGKVTTMDGMFSNP